jgi:hypothetical protein
VPSVREPTSHDDVRRPVARIPHPSPYAQICLLPLRNSCQGRIQLDLCGPLQHLDVYLEFVMGALRPYV